MTATAGTPTAVILHWILTGPEYVREEAVWRSRNALANQDPGDREHYLGELETWVGYHWNYGPHEAVNEHTRQLREKLTYDQIEGAAWLQIAEALVGPEKNGEAS